MLKILRLVHALTTPSQHTGVTAPKDRITFHVNMDDVQTPKYAMTSSGTSFTFHDT
jgi:hypothetical protein